MKTYEQWKSEIEIQIESQKSKHNKVRIYHIAAKMTNETASALKQYFSGEYEVEIIKCHSCLNKWDIMITQG